MTAVTEAREAGCEYLVARFSQPFGDRLPAPAAVPGTMRKYVVAGR